MTLGFNFIFVPQIPYIPLREVLSTSCPGVGWGQIHGLCLVANILVQTFLSQQEKCCESEQKSLGNSFIFVTWSSLFCRLIPATDAQV